MKAVYSITWSVNYGDALNRSFFKSYNTVMRYIKENISSQYLDFEVSSKERTAIDGQIEYIVEYTGYNRYKDKIVTFEEIWLRS